MADYDDNDETSVYTLIHQLSHETVKQRLKSLEKCRQLILDDIKPNGFRRILRAVIGNMVSTPAPEKKWTLALIRFLGEVFSKDSEFDVITFCSEVLMGSSVLSSYDDSKVSVISLTVLLMHHINEHNDIAFSKIISYQGIVIESFGYFSSNKYITKSMSQILAFIISYPHLVSKYVAIWSDPISGTLIGTAELYIMLGQKRQFQQSYDALSLRFMEMFQKRVISAKTYPQPAVVKRFQPLFHSVTSSQWIESIEPSLSRLIKKAPESASHLVNICTGFLGGIDLSTFTETVLVSCCAKILKSTDDDVRKSGVNIVKNISCRCRSAGALISLAQTLVDTLMGKGAGGALTQPAQKWAILEAIKELSSGLFNGLGQEGSAAVAGVILKGILILLDKENDENVRAVIASVLAEWLPLASINNDILENIKNNLSKPKALSTSYLIALSIASASRTSHSKQFLQSLEPLFGTLLTIVKDANKKPTLVHMDAVLALRVILEAGVIMQSAIDALNSAKLWATLFTSSSFLFCPSLLKDLSASSEAIGFKIILQSTVLALERVVALASSEYRAQSKIFECDNQRINEPFATETAASSGTSFGALVASLPSQPATVLIMALLHREVSVRKVVAIDTSVAISGSPAAAVYFVGCLWEFVCKLGAARDAVKAPTLHEMRAGRGSEDSDSAAASGATGSSGATNGMPPSRISETLYHCAKGSANQSSIFPAALLVACHPATSPSIACCRRVANAVVKGLGGVEAVVESFRHSSAKNALFDPIVQALLHRTSVSVRLSGQRALVVLGTSLGHSGEELARELLSGKLLMGLSPDHLQALSPQDLAIYADPAGAMTESSKEEIKITNADKKKVGGRSTRKGAGFGGGIDEEDWAEQLKREKAKKLGLGDAADAAEQKKRQMVEETVSRVEEALSGYRYSLEALQTVYAHDLSLALSCGPDLILGVVALLAFPLVAEDALRCLLCLASSEPCISPLARDWATSLRLIVTLLDRPLGKKEVLTQRAKEVLASNGPIIRTVQGLQQLVHRGRGGLSTNTLLLALPVLTGALGGLVVVPGCESAFMVLSEMWPNLQEQQSRSSTESELVATKETLRVLRPMRRAVLETCLKVLAKIRVHPPADVVLTRVATQQELSPGEWTPLLGSLGLLSEETNVRKCCLRIIKTVAVNGGNLSGPSLESRLWVCSFDHEEAVRSLAKDAWQERRMELSPTYSFGLLPLLSHLHEHVRIAGAKAIIGGIQVHPQSAESAVASLKKLFLNSLPQPAQSPSNGLPGPGMLPMDLPRGGVAVDAAEEKAAANVRVAVAAGLAAIGDTKALPSPQSDVMVPALMAFLLEHGVTDKDSAVREGMLSAGRALVESFGAELNAELLAMLEATLARKPEKGEDLDSFDFRHEAAVVLLGAVGRHLDKESPNIVAITRTMVEALSTPSESVQKSVAECLGPLVQVLKTNEVVKELMTRLLVQVVEGETYGQRRGAAYGVSAFVKGLGIPSLKQYDIVNRLKEACTNGTPNNRQGALFAFECLSDRLGLLFEPYIITILPILLKSFSHGSEFVREAAQLAAKVIMGRLSGHGVKQVLNPILTIVTDEPQWKSRQEAIRLLGTMAFCAPKQLASCLPQIIPKLVDAGSDPHPKVRESARTAMAEISSVIRNPELSRLSPVLLSALGDPSNKTKDALEALIECEFMHSIDAPSLAILVPILARALRDRLADLKRKSSAITGNICSMITDSKVLVPYLAQLLPGLKEVLVDPIPDVRSAGAKALGGIVKGVGEAELPELMPWLMGTLRVETSPVERSGAAQGLAEVCLALESHERVLEILKDVLKLKTDSSPAAREGMQWMLSFLPATFGDSFASYIRLCLPVILFGLSDSAESVREVALRGGQVVVKACGRQHTLELLPSLSEGMFDEDWRIRQSSVSLLGELLYLVGETKAVGMADTDDDDGGDGGGMSAQSRVSVTIRAHIGDKEADKVLSSLYIIRSDTSVTVRQNASQVWKSVVSNTPSTLRQIMPVMVSQVVSKLSSDNADLKQMAGKALGEVVRKLGDHVLPVIMPHLQRGLDSDDEFERQGVCLGLAEILNASSRTQIEDYVTVLVPALQQALCDTSSEVRSQAAQAFQTLSRGLGQQALDAVLPSLLFRISDDDETGLLGLREVVLARPRDVTEYLLPKLLTSPIQKHSARALGALGEMAGGQLNYHFTTIVSGLVQELIYCATDSNAVDEDTVIAVKVCAATLMGAVQPSGVIHLVAELGKEIEYERDINRRRWGIWLTGKFCCNKKAQYGEYVPVLLKYLLSRVTETDQTVLQHLVESLSSLFSTIGPEDMMDHIDFVRNCISSAASDAKHRKGFTGVRDAEGAYLLSMLTVTNSLDPFLPTFSYALMNGNATQRESAAAGIGELASLSDVTVLKPYLIKTAGPLIRVVGDRFPSGVKLAILQTLIVLLKKGAAGLKAFVPQLQTTFVKALSDPSKQVRNTSAKALGMLMSMSTRIDPLLQELVSALGNAESVSIKSSVFEAMASVLNQGGSKATASGMERCNAVVLRGLLEDDEAVRNSAAKCMGGLSLFGSPATVSDLIIDSTSTSFGEAATALSGRVMGSAYALRSAGDKGMAVKDDVLSLIDKSSKSDLATVRLSVCSALQVLMLPPLLNNSAADAELTTRLSEEHRGMCVSVVEDTSRVLRTLLRDETGDVRREAAVAVKEAAKHHPDCRAEFSKQTMAVLVACVGEINVGVKMAAERAMKYLLEVSSKAAVTAVPGRGIVYSADGDQETARFAKDYAKRFLTRLPDDSGDEGDKW